MSEKKEKEIDSSIEKKWMREKRIRDKLIFIGRKWIKEE